MIIFFMITYSISLVNDRFKYEGINKTIIFKLFILVLSTILVLTQHTFTHLENSLLLFLSFWQLLTLVIDLVTGGE